MKRVRIFCFPTFILLFVFIAFGTLNRVAASVDPGFNPQIQTIRYGAKNVTNLIELSNGKILASGNFNNYNGTPVGGLIRLNADASLDTTFNNNGVNAGPSFYTMLVLPNGKIMIRGTLTLSDGTSYSNKIIRLHEDGTLDTSFNFSNTSVIYQVIADAEGRVVMWAFTQVTENGQTVTKQIVRLNDDGSLDPSFNTNLGAISVEKIAAQNNKILFYTFDNSFNQYRLFRLNDNGSIDSAFNVTSLGNFGIIGIKQSNENKILVLSSKRLIRCNENGGMDSNFQSPPDFVSEVPRKILQQSDGRITIGFSSSTPFGMKIIRLLPQGNFDPTFTTYLFPYDQTPAYELQSNGGILIADGTNTGFSNRFTRLLPNGSVDSTYNLGATGFQTLLPGKIRAISVSAGEKVLIGGDFDSINGVIQRKIARLNNDGSLDSSFQLNVSGTGNYFSSLGDFYNFAIQNDGKIVANGMFTYFVGGDQRRNVVRLNADGSIDPTFNLSVIIDDYFFFNNAGKNKTLLTANGKVLVGTTRPSGSNTIKTPLQLTVTGSNDTSFNPTIYNTVNTVSIFDIALQPDGKILISGKIDNGAVTGAVRKGFIARLNGDGTTDQSFQIFGLTDQNIFAFNLLPNGQIIGVSQGNLQSTVFRINSNGSLDNSFNTGNGANQMRGNLAMLKPDGSLDGNIGSPNREVLCITIDSRGRVLIGGEFTAINSGVPSSNLTNRAEQPTLRSYLARLIVPSSSATGRTFFDYDGDGKADISVFRPSAGIWYLQQSTAGFTGVQFGTGSDKIVPADYDGDGKTDLAVFRGGVWYLQRSQSGFASVSFGTAEDIPAPADYDGDGKADLAVFRPSNSTWYLQRSTQGFIGIQFGASGDKPVAADYDGDGKTDLAVNRSGVWYIQRSQLGFTGVSFGTAEDKLVPADYDGDGKADIAVFRPSNSTWYLQRSTAGFTGIQFGANGDLPSAADYDGDGKADIAVFRAGTWYLNRSTQGFTGVSFGVATDLAIPNSYVR